MTKSQDRGNRAASGRSRLPFRLAGIFGVSTIDVRLGVRMLLKNPGLTIVSTLALAVAIAIVAGFYTATQFIVSPALPFANSDRIVAIWQHDIATRDPGMQTVGDMLTWARETRTLENVGGYRLRERSVDVDGATRLARAAEISPSAFRMIPLPPDLGRPLVESDAVPGGPEVVVIGYDFWQSALGADPEIIGRSLRIGGSEHTVVGVMPDGFAFPHHEQVWMPLIHAGPLPDQGAAIDFAFGELARGVSIEDADAELQVIGARLSSEYPDSHAVLRPRVAQFAQSFFQVREPELPFLMQTARLAVGLLLLIVAVNVGALIYARNAARISEIAVRMALGASRSRVVLQMFIEALVLSCIAAALGIAILMWPLTELRNAFDAASAQGDAIPFWVDFGLGSNTFVVVLLLALVSAVLTGALPALKLTGRGVHGQLKRVQQGGSGLKFGKTATLIVVSQVALSVALLTVGSAQLRSSVDGWLSSGDTGLDRSEILTAELRWDLDSDSAVIDDEAALLARAEARRELGRRAASDLDVHGATFRNFQGVPLYTSDTQANDGATTGLLFSYTMAVDPNYFDVMSVRIRTGRQLSDGDRVESALPVAIVNQAFIDLMSIAGDPVGQQVRTVDPRTREVTGEWARIIGVAEDVPELEISERGPQWVARPTVFVPLGDATQGVRMLIRARGEPSAVVAPLQALAAEIDPAMVVHQPIALEEADRVALSLVGIYGIAVGFFVFAALLLSTTGVYAMMSFTTTQRTREIGIRTSLGAPAARVVGAIFSRAIKQLGLGTAIGLGLGYLASDGPLALSGGLFANGPGVVIGVAILVLAMGLIACGQPIRRALRVEPTIALRSDD